MTDDARISQVYRSGLVSFEHLESSNAAMSAALDQARTAAASDVPVLVVGESGTGKNLLAQAIHNAGPRARRSFCEVNCGGLSESLEESELFGHEPGAFTGATGERPGLLEAAFGGTLFLNEIGDVSLSTQRRLLDVLEYKKYRKLGSDSAVEADVRVIGATNKDLQALRRAGEFRDDFFYRINGLRIELPPLRERREDIPGIASRLTKELAKRECRPLSGLAPEAAAVLVAHSWPGNVRELRFVIWRAVLSSRGDRLERTEIESSLGRPEPAKRDDEPMASLEEVERSYLLQVLTRTRWNKTRAAEILEISRPTLHRKIASYGLPSSNPDG